VCLCVCECVCVCACALASEQKSVILSADVSISAF
jgi:hypothetical protein